MEFIQVVWDIDAIVKIVIQEQNRVALYQKPFPSTAEPHDTSPIISWNVVMLQSNRSTSSEVSL